VSEGEPVLLPTLDTLPDEEHESHKVSLAQLTRTAVEKAILGLNEQEGLMGPDGNSPPILRKLVSVVKDSLTLLFNLAKLAGIFPAFWKESIVVPIFKNGEKRDISCYRGISILSVITKLFDHHLDTDFCHAAWFHEGPFHCQFYMETKVMMACIRTVQRPSTE
jgi:hypothetical protein